jgi:hypothetical protein
VYVAAWVVGLLVAPAAPSPTASDAAVDTFFVGHQTATLIQALLVHGLAAAALAIFVVCARLGGPGRLDRPAVRDHRSRRGGRLSRQLGMEIALNRHVAVDGSANATASLFHAVNIDDTIKLVLLGIGVAAATWMAAAAGAFPRWLQGLGFAILPILIIGGLAFVVDSGALSAVLSLSLVLLLIWVAAAGYLMLRARAVTTRSQPEARR